MQLSPWPWYVVGPLIVLTMAALLLSGRRFGTGSNLRTMCTVAGAGTLAEYFRFDWRTQRWNLVFVLGTVCGGAIARFVLLAPDPVALNPATVASLLAQDHRRRIGVCACCPLRPGSLVQPPRRPDPSPWRTLRRLRHTVGQRVHQRTRHQWPQLLQWPSLIAVIGFFIGGLTVTHLVLPHLLPIL